MSERLWCLYRFFSYTLSFSTWRLSDDFLECVAVLHFKGRRVGPGFSNLFYSSQKAICLKTESFSPH